jgi:hypothetical protein
VCSGRDRFTDKTSRRLLPHNETLQMESPSYKRLAAFHAQYLEKHSTPLRARFVYEFGADVAAAMPRNMPGKHSTRPTSISTGHTGMRSTRGHFHQR